MYNNEWHREGQEGYSSVCVCSIQKGCSMKLKGDKLEIDEFILYCAKLNLEISIPQDPVLL